jgi:hypothetical protein
MTIKVRFNTDQLKDPAAPPWRVIVDRQERLARHIEAHGVDSWTTADEIEPGVLKFHVNYEGNVSWQDGICQISPTASKR